MVKIMGASVAALAQLQALLRAINPKAPEGIEQMFLEEGAIEGVRGDIAFCQAIHETNYFRFTGTAKIEWNNTAGLGVTGAAGVGCRFPDWRTGVRAQIQHLKAYASTEPLKMECVDPRFKLVKRGVAPTWTDLNGRWAVPGTTYGQSILKLYDKMIAIDVPTKKVIAIDPGHGGKDRENKGPTGYIEADGVLAISKYMQGFMNATGGWDAKLTRSKDEFIELRERSRIAKREGALIFISEHTNASGKVPNTTARGTEVFYSVDLPDDKDVASALAKSVSSALGIPNRGAKTWSNPKAQPFDGKNTIEDYLAVVDEAQDLGIPHVFLIETAFHDHADDEKLLKIKRNLMKSAIAQGLVLCRSFDVEVPITKEQTLMIQRALNKKGYGLDEDSSYGPQTGSAIMDFEVDNNLKPTGLPSDKLMALLIKPFEEELAEGMKEKGWITDVKYWADVLSGKTQANPEYLQIVIRRALGKE